MRFSRWSKLKTESRSRRGAALPGFAPEPEEALPTTVSEELPEPEAEEALTAVDSVEPESAVPQQEEEETYPEDLPAIEDLDKDSDFSVFMSDKVSDAIRNRALRKLWLTDPVLANLDGLVDYGEDFTDAAMVVKNMKSVYKVGRGMVDYEEEERKKAEAKAAKAAKEAEEAAEGVTGETGETDETVENDEKEDIVKNDDDTSLSEPEEDDVASLTDETDETELALSVNDDLSIIEAPEVAVTDKA